MPAHSESIAALAKALSAFQGEVENAGKTSENPHFRSKYADIAEILNTVRPVLAKHGLSASQHPNYGDGSASVETILMHESGEWMSSTISAPVGKQDAQGVGSAITYCRRYALASILGIAQEDDDANSSIKGPGKRPATVPEEPEPFEWTEEDRQNFYTYCDVMTELADRAAVSQKDLDKRLKLYKDQLAAQEDPQKVLARMTASIEKLDQLAKKAKGAE